jgi:hypothetical protein
MATSGWRFHAMQFFYSLFLHTIAFEYGTKD